MKGLLKYLSPFAPDISGASSVLYEMGGMLVICDAGGCTGNVCGFDEPRWFRQRSCIFSAGLRDMDAIFGRDRQLADKVSEAAKALCPAFIGLIGTPVPAVIGTDFRALGCMIEERTGRKVLTVAATGLRPYDRGAELAYLELFRAFALEKYPAEPDRIGVIGATPLDTGDLEIKEKLQRKFLGKEIVCYGMGDGLEAVRRASAVSRNLVIAPAGIRAARELEERFGTPWEPCCPVAEEFLPQEMPELSRGKILILHQQLLANGIREALRLRFGGRLSVTVAGFFKMEPTLMEPGDRQLRGEETLTDLAEGGFDLVMGDPVFRRFFPEEVHYLEVPHFACSGVMCHE